MYAEAQAAETRRGWLSRASSCQLPLLVPGSERGFHRTSQSLQIDRQTEYQPASCPSGLPPRYSNFSWKSVLPELSLNVATHCVRQEAVRGVWLELEQVQETSNNSSDAAAAMYHLSSIAEHASKQAGCHVTSSLAGAPAVVLLLST